MALTKQKGDIAEAFVTFLLKEKGFNVLFPWGEDNRYDLVVEKGGIFKRVQVKYVSLRNGVIDVPLRSANNHSVIHYSLNDIDVVAAYCPEVRKVYFIPLDRIKNRSSFKLRLKPAKNNQKKFVVLAVDYESRFDFLK
jgi:hypothetical protein